MKGKITIYKSGHAYLGKGVAADGYIGEIDALYNAVTITLVKPNTDLETVKRSLEITLQDVELRITQANSEEGKDNAEQKSTL